MGRSLDYGSDGLPYSFDQPVYLRVSVPTDPVVILAIDDHSCSYPLDGNYCTPSL